MPAEILNRLKSALPKIEASVTNRRIGFPMKTKRPETGRLETLKAELRAMKFVLKLPIISIEYLRDDEMICGLCNKKYDDEFRVCGRGESPCCLPCGHVAGHQCLRKSLSPFELGYTKCPFCYVDFPQMFTDPVEPAQPTSDLAWVDIDEAGVSEKELSKQVSRLSMDSGVSRDEVKRFLSIDEVLERYRSEMESSNSDTNVRDFAAEATGPPDIGKEGFPKNRKMALMVARNF